jgi:hypothetical protein
MSHYPPIPQRKACNCSDPCISTDDVYYAGPNLPNSGINTYNVLTEVIEKLDAIYAVPTLQKVTEMGNYTTLPIIADSFVKIGGDGTNLLLDDGTVLPIGDLPGNAQTLAETLVLGNNTGGTDILLNDEDSLLLENNSYLIKGRYQLGGGGGISRICSIGYEDNWQDGFRHVFDANGFVRNSTNCFNLVPTANSDVTRRYKVGSIWTLDDLTNYICTDATEGAAVWELYKEIPTPPALVFLDEGNGNGIVKSDRDPALFGNIGYYAFDISWSDGTNYGATGESSFAVGDNLTAQGYGSFLIGGGNTSSVDSNYTFQSGYNHSETGLCYANFFTGAGHSVTGGAYATIVGQFANVVTNNPNNVNDGNNTMFAIGNGRAQGDGTLLDRSTALQVYKNGRVVAPSLTTALITADTTGKIVATKEYVDSKRPYKVYTALLTRSGATAPSPTVLENTIGAITFNYGIAGVYYINSVGLFTANKTVVFIQQQQDGPYANNLGASTTSTSSITIIQSTGSGTNDTNWVSPVSIEIRVYN